jgi:hypothetical protein
LNNVEYRTISKVLGCITRHSAIFPGTRIIVLIIHITHQIELTAIRVF